MRKLKDLVKARLTNSVLNIINSSSSVTRIKEDKFMTEEGEYSISLYWFDQELYSLKTLNGKIKGCQKVVCINDCLAVAEMRT